MPVDQGGRQTTVITLQSLIAKVQLNGPAVSRLIASPGTHTPVSSRTL